MSLFPWQKRHKNEPVFKRTLLGADKRTIAVWLGTVGKVVPKQLALRTRRVYDHPATDRVFETHDLFAWKRVGDRSDLIFGIRIDLGSWALLPYADETKRWQDPAGYADARKDCDRCAMKISVRLLDMFLLSPSELLDPGNEVYWLNRIQDLSLDCEGLKCPVDLKNDVKHDGFSAWIQ